MKYKELHLILLLLSLLGACQGKKVVADETPSSSAYRITKTVTYNDVSVDVIIDKPENEEVDVLVVYHGTAVYDWNIWDAANRILDNFKSILERQDMMIVSVVYPEENLLFGDNIAQAEAGLLWVQNRASEELGVTIQKIFLAGHSQGGYLVTRLNTLHATHGVIASAPGPLNLYYRCQLEEDGMIESRPFCTCLRNEYGTTRDNPEAYLARSLINFTNGYKSDILFVQGLQDGYLQMYSWPTFKQKVNDCVDCQDRQFLELPDYGHPALFESPEAKIEFNAFINAR